MSILINGIEMPKNESEYWHIFITPYGDVYNCFDGELTERPIANAIDVSDHGDLIDTAPTIDPVKHGKWGLYEEPDGYYHTECSECGKWFSEDVYWEKTANYCPYCGARMDGE